MASLLTETKNLIAHEFKLEMRQRYALSGLLLYVVSTVFICYLAFRQSIEPTTWNALFWIILLFASVNAVAKSFLNVPQGRMLYLYTLASPQAVILSKIIYNSLLLVVLGVLCFGVFVVLVGNPVLHTSMFLVGVVLGAGGLAGTLTLISAIASSSPNNSTLMAVLGFPVILPLLLTIITFSRNALNGMEWAANLKMLAVLAALNVIVVALSYILFPYLWRD